MELSYNDIIIRPKLTEKSDGQRESLNKYSFKVHPKANKIMIKNALENLFGVKVEKINIINSLGKRVRSRRNNYGIKPSSKKAIVTLKEGDKFEFFETI